MNAPLENNPPKEARFRLLESLSNIPATMWDSCADPDGSEPFSSHAFLSALEKSGSASPQRGWGSCHLLLEDKNKKLLGCMPLYMKTHSQGEYVFDHGWADALERAGIPYYPKLQCAIPFTPVTGRRLLLKKGGDPENGTLLLAASLEVLKKFQVSSLHVTFAAQTEADLMRKHGFLIRTGQQFHWHNQNYQNFDDFLLRLTSRRRKAIKKERAAVASSELTIKSFSGKALTESIWDRFFTFYIDTGSRKWGMPYLTREFFSLLGETMGDKVLLFLAFRGKTPIAGALHIVGGKRLFGRYWGCTEYHRFLHFELCYYQAIDYAIRHQMDYVEAGAQGGHKIERGYSPARTWSAHAILHTGLREAVANYLKSESRAVNEEIKMVGQAMPFKSQDSGKQS